MSSLKSKIVQQLDYLPENALKQVLDFVEFVNWRKTANSEPNSTLVAENLNEKENIPRFQVIIVVPMTTYRNQSWADNSPNLYPVFSAGIAGLQSPSIALLDQIRAIAFFNKPGLS